MLKVKETDIFKEKAIQMAEKIGIEVTSCREVREHKIQGYVVERHYLVNEDKTIIVYANDLAS
jgi:hypothetical protein